MPTVTRPAPAKLNLTLQVVGRRVDGYHLLDSLVAFAEYGDTVAATADDGLHLDCTGPFADRLEGPAEQNLVHRAAVLLAEAAGIRADARITLTKRLPVASGIGGGSSDAAATLSALCELWRLDITTADLAALGLKLGADVPVCLARRTSRLRGIGEQVAPGGVLPAAPVVLVNPGIGLATPAVFNARSGGFSSGPGEGGIFPQPPGDALALAQALAPYPNDLTDAAIRLLPVIGEILARLQAAAGCLLARMSGSGATCFAIFADDPSAAAAADAIGSEHPGWWAVATRLARG